MNTLRRLATAALVAFGFVLAMASQPHHAQAEMMQLTFSGTLTAVDSLLTPYFSTGQDFQGTVLFDSSAANVSSDSNIGLYPAISSASIQIGAYQILKTSGISNIFVGMNLSFFGGNDMVDLSMNSPLSLSGNLGGFDPNQLQLKLISFGGTGFADTSITNMYTASPSQYQYQYMSLTFSKPSAEQSAGIAMNSARNAFFASWNVAPVAVPEPSTYTMAVAGLACGGYSMWRRRERA